MGAARPFRQAGEMWSGQNSKQKTGERDPVRPSVVSSAGSMDAITLHSSSAGPVGTVPPGQSLAPNP
jgi:hypothetical protein